MIIPTRTGTCFRFLTCFAAGLLLTLSAQAQDAPSSSLATAETQDGTAAGSKTWSVSATVDNKGRTINTLWLPANQPYMDAAGKPVTPEFVINCWTDNTVASIDWKGKVGGPDDTRMELVYRLDDNDPVQAGWQLSPDKDILSIKKPFDFLKSLNGAKSLSIAITPYRIPKITAVFDLTDIDKALAEVARRCYN